MVLRSAWARALGCAPAPLCTTRGVCARVDALLMCGMLLVALVLSRWWRVAATARLGCVLMLVVSETVALVVLRRHSCDPLLPMDAAVSVGGVTTVLVPPSRAAQWNIIWTWAAAAQAWTSIARHDDHLVTTPRCKPHFERWRVPAVETADPTVANNLTSSSMPDVREALDAASARRLPLLSYRRLRLPRNIFGACGWRLGEPKLVAGPNGSRFLYGYCRGSAPALWRRLPNESRSEYRANGYKNFLCEFHASAGGCDVSRDVVLLNYARHERPERASAVAKNFLVFSPSSSQRAHGNGTLLAIALIQPHRVYHVKMSTGRMVPLATTHVDLGFVEPVGLSAGPIFLPGGEEMLVAGHTRRGGFNQAMRQTFFYACEARPPFSIRAVTPLVNFGWSPVLEYLTHIELHGDQLHVSLGVADCSSVLLRLPLSAVLRLLVPVHTLN